MFRPSYIKKQRANILGPYDLSDELLHLLLRCLNFVLDVLLVKLKFLLYVHIAMHEFKYIFL